MTGRQLKQRREATGLTQVQFADKLGIHPISLSRYEREADPIPKVVALAVSEVERQVGAKATQKSQRPAPVATLQSHRKRA